MKRGGREEEEKRNYEIDESRERGIISDIDPAANRDCTSRRNSAAPSGRFPCL